MPDKLEPQSGEPRPEEEIKIPDLEIPEKVVPKAPDMRSSEEGIVAGEPQPKIEDLIKEVEELSEFDVKKDRVMVELQKLNKKFDDLQEEVVKKELELERCVAKYSEYSDLQKGYALLAADWIPFLPQSEAVGIKRQMDALDLTVKDLRWELGELVGNIDFYKKKLEELEGQ